MSVNRLQNHLYTAAQVRELDRLAIAEGVEGFELMSRAASAGFDLLKQQWPNASKILVICGAGNNAGDGYCLATLALQEHWQVHVISVREPAQLNGDALLACQRWSQSGGQSHPPSHIDKAIHQVDVIVDALLGTGLQRTVTGDWAQLIDRVNESPKPVLALDIASGLHADSGQIMGIAVRADVTISFIAYKRGTFTASANDVCGKLFFDDLDVTDSVYSQVPCKAYLIDDRERQQLLSPRKPSSHKGDFGHVLLVGGNAGMPGAIQMAALAAARAGAALVSIATRSVHAVQIAAACPGLMVHAVENVNDLQSLLERVDVVAIGPGLGQDAWANDLLEVVVIADLPLIIDADGLNLLARKKIECPTWILTPHPAEAARLLQCSTSDIELDRYAAVKRIASQYGGVSVLKGNGSLIADSNDSPVFCCQQGNPGMACAGMGDVLTGIIAALVAQGLSLQEAARMGVYIHANAGDSASENGQRGMLATDLLSCIRQWVNP